MSNDEKLKNAKVISFINMKGGVGKTTLAINVGYELSKSDGGKKVLIVDMDPQFNATQSLLLYKTKNNEDKEDLIQEEEEQSVTKEIRSSEYYGNLSDNKQTVLQIFEKTNIDKVHNNPSLALEIINNLYLIPGDLNMAKEITGDTSNKVGAVMEHLEDTNILSTFDYVIIDCPPTWSILTHSSLVASDYYIIPSKIDFYSSIGIKLLKEQIEKKILRDSMYRKMGKELKEIGIVFTLTHKNIVAEDETKRYLKQQFPNINFLNSELPYMPSVPTKFVLFNEAEGNQIYSQLSNSIEKLSYEIKSKLV